MKTKLKLLAIPLALFLATAAPVSVTLTSCKALPTTSAETSDQFILRAEQAAEAAKLTFNLLVHVERDNEAALKQANPQIHVFAEKIRRDGISYIQQLRSATMTFKYNRTADNKASLDTYLKTVLQAISDANNYISQSKSVTNP